MAISISIVNVSHFSFQNITMAWITLIPDLIFSDIMMMFGLESLNSLHRCRQVCKTWNEKILRDIWENQRRKKIMKIRIEKNWGPGMFPTDEELSHAKWLGDGCCWNKFHVHQCQAQNTFEIWPYLKWPSSDTSVIWQRRLLLSAIFLEDSLHFHLHGMCRQIYAVCTTFAVCTICYPTLSWS